MKIAASTGAFILIIWGGALGLISILDHYGFGPNTQTQQDRIEQNLRGLKSKAGLTIPTKPTNKVI